MKSLFRIRRIFVGLVFVEVLLSLIICSYYLVLAMLPEYLMDFPFVLNLFVSCLSIIIVTSVVLFYFYKIISRKTDERLFRILFVDLEPTIAFDYIQQDLSLHTFITQPGIEKSILQSVLIHLFMGNFDKAELIIEHLNINYFDRVEKNEKTVLLYHKADLLVSAFTNNKEEFFKKYIKYHDFVDLNEDLDGNYPSEKLNSLIELFFVLFNFDTRLDIIKYLENYEYSTSFEKYSITAYLLYHEYKLPQYVLDEYESKLNSLFINLDKNN